MLTNSARRIPSFWFFQLGGWFTYGVASAVVSFPFWHERSFVAFRIAFLVSAFLASFLIYWLCHSLRQRRIGLFASLAWCVLACSILGLLCSLASQWSEVYFGGYPGPFNWRSGIAGSAGSAFVLLAWSAIYFGIKHYIDLEDNRVRLAQSEALAREAQLRALRYQLQPHFLFNTLNAISTLVLDDRKDDAAEMISRLADMLRNSLDAPDVHFVPLEEELLLVRQYLAIEQVRFGPRLEVAIEAPPETLTAMVPRLILQPLVENAIRHGIARLADRGRISIRARVQDGNLQLEVLNDIAGPQDGGSARTNAGGLGLENTRVRLRHLYGEGQFLKSRIVRGTLAGEFQVLISIPLQLPKAVPDAREAVMAP